MRCKARCQVMDQTGHHDASISSSCSRRSSDRIQPVASAGRPWRRVVSSARRASAPAFFRKMPTSPLHRWRPAVRAGARGGRPRRGLRDHRPAQTWWSSPPDRGDGRVLADVDGDGVVLGRVEETGPHHPALGGAHHRRDSAASSGVALADRIPPSGDGLVPVARHPWARSMRGPAPGRACRYQRLPTARGYRLRAACR